MIFTLEHLSAKHLPYFLCLAIGLSCSSLTSAKTPDIERYHVEVIVFTQTDSYKEEAAPIQPELRYPRALKQLKPQPKMTTRLAPTATYNEKLANLMVPRHFMNRDRAKAPQNYTRLHKSNRLLNPDAYTLRRNKNYRILFHQAWQQPLTNSKRAAWIHLNGGKFFGGNSDGGESQEEKPHQEMQGSFRIYKNRFVHAETNLWLSQLSTQETLATKETLLPTNNMPQRVEQQTLPKALLTSLAQRAELLASFDPPESFTTHEPPTEELSLQNIANDALNKSALPTLTVSSVDLLQETHQLRFTKLHYIDHPRVGMLVLIRPIVEDDAEQILTSTRK